MTRSSQKERERRAVGQLRQVLVDFPRDAAIESCEDPLDVVVTQPDGHKIGIEVTDFVRDGQAKGSALDSYQKLIRKIAAASEDVYASRGGKPLYTTVKFSRSLSCGARGIRALAEQIANRALQIADAVEEAHSPISADHLPPGIDEMVVHPLRLPRPQFAPSYSGCWEYLTSAHIERILEQKETKVHSYRKKCDELWLLIYVDSTRMSGWVEPPEDMQLETHSMAFDRIFFLYGDARVIEITRA
ncbi:MAG TPA: hypothetical protein VGQ21_03020 [Thermoanaerobaculia bacterium]|nr:hypothetical protein [Thermoanaerobaculia bacterium]